MPSRAGKVSVGAGLAASLTVVFSVCILTKATANFYRSFKKRYQRSAQDTAHTLDKFNKNRVLPDIPVSRLGTCWRAMRNLQDKVFPHRLRETYDGQLEPPAPYESNAAMRQRCARNYVRKLLRGRKWLKEELQREQAHINKRGVFKALLTKVFNVPVKVKTHMPYERDNDVFYPERMWMACLLSLWLQLMFNLCFVYFTAGLIACFQRANDLALALRAHAEAGAADVGTPSALTGPEAILYLLWSIIYQMAGIDTSTVQDMASWVHFLLYVAILICVINTAHVVIVWVGIFGTYRNRICMVRQGQYFFDRCRFGDHAASSYIGYQVAFILGGSFISCFTLALVLGGGFIGLMSVFTFLNSFESDELEAGELSAAEQVVPVDMPPLLNDTATAQIETYMNSLVTMTSAGRAVPSVVWWLLVPLVGQAVLNYRVFYSRAEKFRDGRIGNSWVRFRFWFSLYEYMLVLPNIAIGFFFVLWRLLLACLLAGFYVCSMDRLLVPGTTLTETWDYAYAAYVGMFRNDHRYNNPPMIVFMGIMQDKLTENRLRSARAKFRREQMKRQAVRRARLEASNLPEAGKGCFGGFFRRPGATMPKRRPKMVEAKLEDEAADSDVVLEDHVMSWDDTAELRRRYLLVRNRWQLARLLMLNPSLQAYRSHKITVHGIHAMDLVELAREASHGASNRASSAAHAASDVASSAARAAQDGALIVADAARNRASSTVGQFSQKDTSKPTGEKAEELP
jgi:hypothetical protein